MQSPTTPFRKILVGVDLSKGDLLVSEDLAPPSQEAVARALKLASLNQAELHFFFALDVGARTERLIKSTEGLSKTVLDMGRSALQKLEEQAKKQGLSARSTVVLGKSWLELIRQVLREGSDLVVVGTRHLGRVHGAIVGSTGMRLLRKCPCPVWIAQPVIDSALDQILVATDFSPACDRALELAIVVARLQDAELRLLHVIDLPEETSLESLLSNRDEYRENRDRLEEEAHTQLGRLTQELSTVDLPKPPRTYLLRGDPSTVIQEQVEQLKIDLLVMGTVARTGIPGLLMGNTAERILPEVDCSILALKPPGYASPVELE